MMMMCVMPMNCITCICEDSQMYMSSEKETGLPAHNYQNACSQILERIREFKNKKDSHLNKNCIYTALKMSFKQVAIPAFFSLGLQCFNMTL